jgi:hypothetical protein
MKLRAFFLASVVWMPLVHGACGTDPPASFPTYQACFDDHAMVEMLPVQEAIVVCCIDHPIAGLKPACGATKADCINYLTANLNQTSASTVDVMDACTDYITQMQNPPAP